MKKALRILNDVTYDAIGVPMFHSSCVSDDIEEAKEELKEAMKPKTCEGCTADCSVKDALNAYSQFWDYPSDVGCKSRHEPKEK